MTSKVKKVTASGTSKTDYGILYDFLYELEDGQVLTARHKSADNFFKEGVTVDYNVKGTYQGVDYGSVSLSEEHNAFKQPFQKDDSVQRYIVRQSSLNRAIEHLSYKDQDLMTKENVVALAEYYTNWVLEN